MDQENFNMEIPISELGTIGLAIATLGWVVKAFLGHLKTKDELFSKTINNHLTHSIEAQERLTSAVDKLSQKL